MSLTIYPDVVQGSDEWHDQRRGMVTASVMGQLITPTLKIASNLSARSLINELVAQRITGYTEPQFVSDAMMRGHEDEIRARDLYAKTNHVTVDTLGFMVRDFEAETYVPAIQIGFSPDGLVGADGFIEVKSRMQKHQLATILADEVPGEFMAQIQTGLLVSGRDWCDFLSFCGGMPMPTIRVEPIPGWGTAILEAVTAFEESAMHMTATYRNAIVGLPVPERIIYEEII